MNKGKGMKLVYPDLQSNVEFYHEGNYRGMSAEKLQVLIDLLKWKESELTENLRELYNETILEIEQERERILKREKEITFVINDTYKQSDRTYSADCYSIITTNRGELGWWEDIKANLWVNKFYPAMSKSAYIKVTNTTNEDIWMNVVVNNVMVLQKEDDYEDLKNIKSLHIWDLHVNEENRGNGYGWDLLSTALELANLNGCQYITWVLTWEALFLEELIREEYPNVIVDVESRSFLINL